MNITENVLFTYAIGISIIRVAENFCWCQTLTLMYIYEYYVNQNHETYVVWRRWLYTVTTVYTVCLHFRYLEGLTGGKCIKQDILMTILNVNFNFFIAKNVKFEWQPIMTSVDKYKSTLLHHLAVRYLFLTKYRILDIIEW